jgi:hypothetical protein
MQAIEQDPKALLFNSHAVALARMKAFFITKKGYMGTASHSITVGDQVALVSGVHVPLVFRKWDDNEAFRLMGPAFVHGVVYGEAWQDVLNGGLTACLMTTILSQGVESRLLSQCMTLQYTVITIFIESSLCRCLSAPYCLVLYINSIALY